MSRVYEATVDLLETHPETERALVAMLAVDVETETWQFQDVHVNPDLFATFVSRGIVVGGDGEFRLRDAKAVQAALQGEPNKTGRPSWWARLVQRPTLNPRTVLGLVAALGFLVLMRLWRYRTVVREGHVVSPGQQPFHNRYWLDRLLVRSNNPWSLDILASLPNDLATTRPITHATHWWLAALLGGDRWAAELVAAWFPVVAAVIVGVAIYGTAVLLTSDVRVGLGAVFLFALTPFHIGYAGVGFLDHRPHQYLWLAVTVLCLTYLAVDVERRVDRDTGVGIRFGSTWTWLATLGLAVGLAFSVLSWTDPLMALLPIALYVCLRVVIDVRSGVDPIGANSPVVFGMSIATGIIGILHLGFGWIEPVLVGIPLFVLGGCILVMLMGETCRYGVGLPGFLALQAIAGVLGLGLLRRQYPDVWDRVIHRAAELLVRDWVSESSGLLSDEFGLLDGLLVHGGVLVVLGGVGLYWVVRRGWRTYSPGWLVMIVYGVVWLVLAVDQLSFIGHMAVVWAVPSGLALVGLLSRFGIVRPPTRFHGDRREKVTAISVPESAKRRVSLVAVIVGITALSIVLVPVMGTDAGHLPTHMIGRLV